MGSGRERCSQRQFIQHRRGIQCGRAERNVGDYHNAIDDFNKAMPLSLKMYQYRGNATSNIEDYAGAITDFTFVLKFAANDANFMNSGGG